MSDQYGKGFKTRMTILLLILVVVAGGFYYDRFIIVPRNKERMDTAINTLQKMMDSEEANTSGISPDAVHSALDMKPSETETDTENKFYVETYSFPRLLPFIAGDYLNLIYAGVDEGKTLVKYQNRPYNPDEMEDPTGGIYTTPEDQRGEIVIGGGGGGSRPKDDGKSDTEGDDSGEGDTKADDSKEGDSKEDDSKAGDAKGDDTKEGDTKEGDTKEGDTKEGDSKEGETKGDDSKGGDTTESGSGEGDQ